MSYHLSVGKVVQECCDLFDFDLNVNFASLSSFTPLPNDTIVCDPNTLKVAQSSFPDSQIFTLPQVSSGNDFLSKRASIEIQGFNFQGRLIACGGGRVHDMVKYFSKEWVSFPTCASMNGFLSNSASLIQGSKKISIKCEMPSTIILDEPTLSSSPPELTKAGYHDCISQYFSEIDFRLHPSYTPKFFEHFQSLPISDNPLTLLPALLCQGIYMSAFGGSNPCSGLEHAISHSLEISVPILHGISVGHACQYLYAVYNGVVDDECQNLLDKYPQSTFNTSFLEREDLSHIYTAIHYRDRKSIASTLSLFPCQS